MMRSWLPFILATVGSVTLTPLVIALSRRMGLVAIPREDRWHQRPTALFGGVAIYLSCLLGIAAAWLLVDPRLILRRELAGLLVGATLVFVLGLVDDARGVSPTVKLLVQTLAAGIFVVSGLRGATGAALWLGVPAGLLWIVGITNAANLLDNMDGIVAGVVGMAAAALAIHGLGAPSPVTLAAQALAGACVGFLVYNFNPARVFMGDCGSLFLGFVVSSLCLLRATEQNLQPVHCLVLPVALLAVPILDTTLVIVVRTREGRPIWNGGRDHSTHRLVQLGFSERGVALLLYGSSLILGSLGVASTRWSPEVAGLLAVSLLATLGLSVALLGSVTTAAGPHRRLRPAGGSERDRSRPAVLAERRES